MAPVTGNAPATIVATDSATRAATSAASTAYPAGGSMRLTIANGSEASYKVREQLASINFPTDAIGKTSQISGQIVVQPDGKIDAANSKFTVDLSTLVSDRPQRDNFIKRNVLQTDQYPDATFVPTQVSGLPSPVPTSGSVTFKLTGNMTIRDVTKPVTWDVTGQVQGNQASGQATTSFTFEYFNLQQPRVPVVLSVVDNITLQVNLVMQIAG